MKLSINEAILDRDNIIKTIFTKEVLNNLSNRVKMEAITNSPWLQMWDPTRPAD